MERVDPNCGRVPDPDSETRCDLQEDASPTSAADAGRIDEHLHHRLMVRNAMDEAERKAWDAFSRYKFIMGGYHAAQWVTLNKLLEDAHQPSPFSDLVKLAREHTVKD